MWADEFDACVAEFRNADAATLYAEDLRYYAEWLDYRTSGRPGADRHDPHALDPRYTALRSVMVDRDLIPRPAEWEERHTALYRAARAR